MFLTPDKMLACTAVLKCIQATKSNARLERRLLRQLQRGQKVCEMWRHIPIALITNIKLERGIEWMKENTLRTWRRWRAANCMLTRIAEAADISSALAREEVR
jgi:hypothetical protein